MKELIFFSKFLLIAFLATSVAAQYDSFETYVARFSKVYSPEEYAARKTIYEANIAKFSQITNFIPGVNNFTDWTESEIKGLSTLKELPESERKSSEDQPEIKLGAPVSLDWRGQNILTSIKDQGGCGACWAFTSVGLAQSFLLQTGAQSTGIDLSEQFLLQCTSDCDCGGGFIQYGLDKISKKCPQENQYSYIGPSLYGGSICSADGVTTKTKRSSYYDITDSALINLVQYRPVAVAVASTGWSSYSSGTITCSSSDPVDHAVILVGYTANYYIIRNSWGTSWGMNGYAYLSRASGSNCQVLSQAHIITQSNYEPYHLITIILLLTLMILY